MKPSISSPESQLSRTNKGKFFFLRLAWFISFAYTIFSLLNSGPSFTEINRFNQLYEDAYLFFSRWITFHTFMRLAALCFLVLALAYFLIAIIIFARKSRDRLGLLTSISLLGVSSLSLSSFYLHPDSSLEFIQGILVAIWIYSISRLLFVFPNKQFIPVKFALPFHLIYFFLVAMVLVGVVFEYEFAFGMALTGVLALNITGIISQVYRFLRVSDPIEKQQTKWVFFSLLVLAIWGLFALVDPGKGLRFEARAIYAFILILTGFIGSLLLPVAFSISIFRHRLYDIDLIIRRSIQYSVLTGLLVLVYYGLILLLQFAFTVVTGRQDSSVIMVVSTLSIAAVFNPIRKRVQNFINMRFYRNAYNAELTLASFAETARHEVDLFELSQALIDATEAAMRPERISLWLKN